MQPTIRRFALSSLALACGLLAWSALTPQPAVHAQGPANGPLLTPQQAGREAYWYHESRRQANVQRQLGWIDTTRWLNGLPNRYTGLRNSPSLAAIYSGATEGLVPGGYVFEPWPYVPGDIYGFQWDGLGSQPIGNDITFAGPNRYSYRSVYSVGPNTAPTPPPGAVAPVDVPPPPAAAMPFDPDPAAIAAKEAGEAALAARPAAPLEIEPAAGAERLLAAAQRAFRAGRTAEALRVLDAAAADIAVRPEAELLRSHVLFALGKFEDAAASLRQAVATLPWQRHSAVLQGFERDYPSADGYTARLRQLERAIAAAPREPQLRLLLGYHYGYLGFLPEAVTELSQVLQLKPEETAAATLQEHFLQRLEGPAPGRRMAPPAAEKPEAEGRDPHQQPMAPPHAEPPVEAPDARKAEAPVGPRSF